MKNKLTPQIYRHGELLLKPILEIPKEAKMEKSAKRYIVAHSETGHHHTLATKLSDFKVYTWKGDTYLEVPEMSELLHEKTGKDVHKTHKIAPGNYKIIIKKHFDYFKGALEKVRD